MTKEQAAAFVFSQSVCALAEIEAMKAANREQPGRYNHLDFLNIHTNYPISHSAVLQLFQDIQ